MTTELHHLAAAYALDALDPEERRAFEAHYPDCETCALDVAAYRATATELGAGVGVAPPGDVRRAVLAEIHQTRQLSPLAEPSGPGTEPARRLHRPGRPDRRAVLLGAAALVLVALAGLLTVLRGEPGGPSVEEILAAPDAVVTSLEGDDGTLRVVWSADLGSAGLVGSDLDQPGDRRTYALWALTEESVSPAGLFRPEPDGEVSTVLEVEASPADGWGVSIEPEGGAPQPTGEVLYAGTF